MGKTFIWLNCAYVCSLNKNYISVADNCWQIVSLWWSHCTLVGWACDKRTECYGCKRGPWAILWTNCGETYYYCKAKVREYMIPLPKFDAYELERLICAQCIQAMPRRSERRDSKPNICSPTVLRYSGTFVDSGHIWEEIWKGFCVSSYWSTTQRWCKSNGKHISLSEFGTMAVMTNNPNLQISSSTF